MGNDDGVEMNPKIGLRFNYQMYARPKGTNLPWIKVAEVHNLITNVGLYMIGDALIDVSSQYDTGITYQAIGTDNTAPLVTDTALGGEGGTRQTLTNKSRSGAVLTLSTFFTAAQCAVAIEEAGLFGTSTATAAADSGVMFNRALLSYDNSGGTYDITIDCVITISEVT